MTQQPRSNILSTIISTVLSSSSIAYLSGSSLNQISMLLYNDRHFRSFVLFNDISLETFSSLIAKAKVLRYDTDTPIFREDAISNGFYLLVRGSLSFRIRKRSESTDEEKKENLIKRLDINRRDIVIDKNVRCVSKKSLKNTNLRFRIKKMSIMCRTYEEKEMFKYIHKENVFLFGNCDLLKGDYSSLNRLVKNEFSVYASEDDTYIFHFDNFSLEVINELIAKSANLKVKFIKNHFSFMSSYSYPQVAAFLTKIKLLHPPHHSVIQNEPNCIYLIYNGTCSPIQSHKIIYDKGDFIYLSSLFDTSNHTQILSSSNDVVLFCLPLSEVPPHCTDELLSSLRTIYNHQQKIMSLYVSSSLRFSSIHNEDSTFPSIPSSPVYHKPRQRIKLLKPFAIKKKCENMNTPIKTTSQSTRSMFTLSKKNSSTSLSTGKTTRMFTSIFNESSIIANKISSVKHSSHKLKLDDMSESFKYMYNANVNSSGSTVRRSSVFNVVNMISMSGKKEKENSRSLSLEEKIVYNVKKWKNILNEKKVNFDTKNFNIVLIHRLMNSRDINN